MTKEDYTLIGIDYEDAMNRFMNNETMYLKFLYDFKNDSSYQEMMDAIKSHDVNAAFEAAHSLKGVSGNLSMIDLYQSISILVEDLRQDDLSRMEILLPPVEKSYLKIIEYIQ